MENFWGCILLKKAGEGSVSHFFKGLFKELLEYEVVVIEKQDDSRENSRCKSDIKRIS